MPLFSLPRFSSLAPAVVMAALGASLAMAQESAQAPAEAGPTDGLSMGQTPQEGPGSSYVKESFNDWELRCVRVEAGAEPCQLYQLLKDTQGTAVAEIGLFALPEGGEAAAGATIIVPLETLLTAGLRLGVDEAQPKIYPFTFCSQVGCVARVGFTAAEVDAFRKGGKAVLTIVPAVAADQTVALDVSLAGFTAGFEAVAATRAAATEGQN